MRLHHQDNSLKHKINQFKDTLETRQKSNSKNGFMDLFEKIKKNAISERSESSNKFQVDGFTKNFFQSFK